MRIKIYYACLLLLGAHQISLGQQFPCDGRMFLFLNQGRQPTFAHWVDYQSIENVFFNTFTTFADVAFDAVGFNSQDNFIYAVQSNTNKIIRLKSDGSFEVIGTVPMVDVLDVTAGDCSPEGQFVCFENNLKQLLFFDVINDFALVKKLDLFWATAGGSPFETAINDLAFDPTDPTVAYSFQDNHDGTQPVATRGNLLKMNLDFNSPNVGLVSPLGSIDKELITQMGGLLFTNEGNLFGYGSKNPGPNFLLNQFIEINKTDARTTPIRSGPGATVGDACSCPYNLTFKKGASPRILPCSQSEVVYEFTLINRFKENLFDLTINDTFPTGILIRSIDGNFKGKIEPGTGVGTRFLTITNLEAPQNEEVFIRLKTEISFIPLGLSSSQAFLRGLPQQFGDFFRSDDPQTDGVFADATLIYGTPQTLDDVEFEVIQPASCFRPNDGKIVLSSPLLIKGERYQVEYINDDWDYFTRDVVVDDLGACIIDSLIPNGYTLKSIYFKENECGFSLDKRFQISTPNESLLAEAASNSPICVGADLQLQGTAFPESDVFWIGPNGFISTELRPTIPKATLRQSGTYTFTSTLGSCIQEKEVEVMIASEVNASVEAVPPTCEGASIQLIAHEDKPSYHHQWLGPNNWMANGQTVELSPITLANQGNYHVIVDNGGCSDTATVNVIVYPKPKIQLPARVATDFCNAKTLNPKINGGNSLTFEWEASNGLSCLDCSNPEIIPPFDSQYRLSVVNEWSCRDTAEVQVIIDPEKLMFVPNAFSPNADGINDYFEFFPGCGVKKLISMQVFDQWGNQVFASGSMDYRPNWRFWDGYIRGKKAESGNYIWRSKIELIDGRFEELSGLVSLFR